MQWGGVIGSYRKQWGGLGSGEEILKAVKRDRMRWGWIERSGE